MEGRFTIAGAITATHCVAIIGGSTKNLKTTVSQHSPPFQIC